MLWNVVDRSAANLNARSWNALINGILRLKFSIVQAIRVRCFRCATCVIDRLYPLLTKTAFHPLPKRIFQVICTEKFLA